MLHLIEVVIFIIVLLAQATYHNEQAIEQWVYGWILHEVYQVDIYLYADMVMMQLIKCSLLLKPDECLEISQ